MDILRVEASGGYSYLYFRNRPRLIVAQKLKAVERRLPPGLFARVHRGHLVNLYHVDTFTGNSLKIGEQWIPIGESYRSFVRNLFSFL